MILSLAIFAATGGAAWMLSRPSLAQAAAWRAAITPLASIIGSGFLLLGPILQHAFGGYAPLAMAGLCAVAWSYGSAIRFNIAALERTGRRGALETRLESLASLALAFAYIISVAYYLNLFGAFGVSLTPFAGRDSARLVTSATFALVLAVGWLRGFHALERVELISVGVKLTVIVGLLTGLAAYFWERAIDGALIFPAGAIHGWEAVALGFGLLVTVQGFETSRYLGEAYDAETRIRSMKRAQQVSSAIYLIYIALIAFAFDAGSIAPSETAVIDMMAVVAPVLPAMLVLAALSAQLSAAIADTAGSGGLFHELSGRRISERQAYAGLVAVGLVMTWTTSVLDTVAYASRAFAIYYGLQAAIAAITAWRAPETRHRAAPYAALTLLAVLIALFGASAES